MYFKSDLILKYLYASQKIRLVVFMHVFLKALDKKNTTKIHVYLKKIRSSLLHPSHTMEERKYG